MRKSNQDQTAKMKREVEEVRKLPSPFAVGKGLHEIERKFDRSISKILRGRSADTEKGRKWGMLTSFLKLYRVYRDFPQIEMIRLKDAVALSLANGILSGNPLTRTSQFITDDECNMLRKQALELALSNKFSGKSLEIVVRNNRTYIPPFKNEGKITSWFNSKSVRESFCEKHSLEFSKGQVAPGKAMGDVDYIFYRRRDDSLVLVELKDSVDFHAVGQALGFRNELIEKSRQGTDSSKVAIVYPLHKNNHRKKYLPKNEKHISYCSVEIWIVGQVFKESAYYAGKGTKDQNISFLRITDDKEIEGPVSADNLTWEKWC